MKLLQTTVDETHVHMLLADADTKEGAGEWVELRVPLSKLADPADAKQPLDQVENHYVGGVQLSALTQAQAVISEEIRRLRAEFRRT